MTKKHEYSRSNAKLTLVSTFFGDLAFILPIWLLFSTLELGFSALLATSLFMSVWVVSGLLEIPAGALADRLGRRRMYLIGIALLSLYPLAYALKLPILFIFLLSLVSGIGSALRSGTLVALTHESYRQDNRSEQEYHTFLSSQLTVTFISRALSGVAGGFLYMVNPVLPFVAMFVSYVLTFISGLFVVDTAEERSTLSNRLHIKETLRQIWRAPLVITLLIAYIAIQILGEAVWTAYQPFFANDGLSPSTIGLLFSVIAIVSGTGSYMLRFITKRFRVLTIQAFAGFLTVIAALLLNTPSNLLHLIAVIPAAFSAGISITPLMAVTQKFVASTYHTTALSIINVVQYLVYGAASLYVSFALDTLGDKGTRQLLAVEALVVAFVLLALFINKRRLNVIITKKDQLSEQAQQEGVLAS